MTVYDLKGGNIISAPQKSTAWNALSILERDLEMMYNSYRCENYQYYKVVNIWVLLVAMLLTIIQISSIFFL